MLLVGFVDEVLIRCAAARAFRNIAEGVKEKWAELLEAEKAVDKEAGIAHQEGTSSPSLSSPVNILQADWINSDCIAAPRYGPFPKHPVGNILTTAAHTAGLSEMLALLRDTNALHESITRIERTVANIFQSIQGAVIPPFLPSFHS